MAIDVYEFTKEFKELKEKSEKFDNIKKFFEEKAGIISQKINEIHHLLAEINPELHIKKKYSLNGEKKIRQGGVVRETVAQIVQYFRENPNEELTTTQIQEKWKISSGGTITNIRLALAEQKEIKIKLDPNYKKRSLYGYNSDVEIPEFLKTKTSLVTDRIEKEQKKGFGIAEEKKQKEEILAETKLPIKFSYMK